MEMAHTAQAPAILATIPPEIIMGLKPLVLLKTIPLIPPAAILLAESCFPRTYPMDEFRPLYSMATTPAEFPRKGPRLVTEFSTVFNRIFGGAVTGVRRSPSERPHAPPTVSAARYVVPVP